MKKTQKRVVAILFALVFTLFLVYLGINKDTDQVYAMKLDHFETNLAELKIEKEIIEQEINTFYADEDQTFIVESLTIEELDQFQKNIAKYEEKLTNVNKELFDLTARDQKKYTGKMKENQMSDSVDDFYIGMNDLKIKKELTDRINKLFAKKYIQNKTINKEAFIVETLELKEFEKSQKMMKQKLTDNELKSAKEFTEMIETGLKIAQDQLDDLNEAIVLRDEIFDENNYVIVTDVIKIDDFLLAVEKIKNPKIRSTFDEYIHIAENYEIKEVEEEPEATDEMDPSYQENQESSNYQSPSTGGGSGSGYTGGPSSGYTGWSSGSSTGGSSSSSTGGSSSGSSGGSTNESNSSSSDTSTDESTDDSNENNSPDESPDSSNESDANDESDNEYTEESDNNHHESQR